MTRLRYLAKTPYALFGVLSVLVAGISIWSHLQQALIPEITGFVYAARSGYTWMSAVTIIFFLIAITGILNKEILRFKTRNGYLIWLALHIGLSVSILPLILVHIWVALAY